MSLAPILKPEALTLQGIRLIAAGVNRWLDRVDTRTRAARTTVGRTRAQDDLEAFETWIAEHWVQIPEVRRLEALGWTAKQDGERAER